MLLILLTATFVAATPQYYESVGQVFWARTVSQVLLMWAVGLIVFAWMTKIRRGCAEAKATSELARIDALTGLQNRRALEEALPVAVHAARRHGEPFAVVRTSTTSRASTTASATGRGRRAAASAARSINAAVRLSDPSFAGAATRSSRCWRARTLEEAEQIARRVRDTVASSCHAPDNEPLQITACVALLGGARPERTPSTAPTRC